MIAVKFPRRKGRHACQSSADSTGRSKRSSSNPSAAATRPTRQTRPRPRPARRPRPATSRAKLITPNKSRRRATAASCPSGCSECERAHTLRHDASGAHSLRRPVARRKHGRGTIISSPRGSVTIFDELRRGQLPAAITWRPSGALPERPRAARLNHNGGARARLLDTPAIHLLGWLHAQVWKNFQARADGSLMRARVARVPAGFGREAR